MIYKDIKAKAMWLYQGATFFKIIRAIISDGTFCMILYRTMSACNKYLITRLFALIISKINAILCGCVIGPGARFDEEFVILHSVGIVINSKVSGGKNIILESGVVIGEEKRKNPTLGNNIFIGSGAKIIGGIEIGNNVTVGANAVIIKNVPSNVVVVGVPGKIIKTKNDGPRI